MGERLVGMGPFEREKGKGKTRPQNSVIIVSEVDMGLQSFSKITLAVKRGVKLT